MSAPQYIPERDPTIGVLNPSGIRQFSGRLADQVQTSFATKAFPLVLGGDCSILIGVALALHRQGRFGMLFLDGHADFYSPASEPNGEVASMELAVITGRGPQLTSVAGPLIQERDTVAFAVRDIDASQEYGSPDVRETEVIVIDYARVEQLGARRAAEEAVSHLENADLDGFWVHLDADVLNDAAMPAVDYRMDGGLTTADLTDVLVIALRSPRAIGLDVTIYNPALDDEHLTAGHRLLDVLAESFGAAT